MLKWFIFGTLLYYAILYGDTGTAWEHGSQAEKESRNNAESKTTVKTGNGDLL